MDFAAGFLFVWGYLPSYEYDPMLNTLHTLYLFTQGRGEGGGRANQREG